MIASAGVGAPSRAQSDCEDTPEGRICRVSQPIVAGAEVDVAAQRDRGLVAVASPAGACSGTLLNRFWVLTARHCVTNPTMANPSAAQAIAAASHPPGSVSVTAEWAPGRLGVTSRIHDLSANTGPGVTPGRDIVLLYLGTADLGPAPLQRLFAVLQQGEGGSVTLRGRLLATDAVDQYGSGLSAFATGTFGAADAAPSDGAGVWRTARFAPSGITETHYDLAMNAASQVGHGGDSGGPTRVIVDGSDVGIAGVQSTCAATGYLPGTPPNQRTWAWATGISLCTYVSVAPFHDEIRRVIAEAPPCVSTPARCGMPAIVHAVLSR